MPIELTPEVLTDPVLIKLTVFELPPPLPVPPTLTANPAAPSVNDPESAKPPSPPPPPVLLAMMPFESAPRVVMLPVLTTFTVLPVPPLAPPPPIERLPVSCPSTATDTAAPPVPPPPPSDWAIRAAESLPAVDRSPLE